MPASISNVHGPLNMRRCSVPMSPGPGLVKLCPEKFGCPSWATPRPSVPMADGEMMYGPFPVIWNLTICFSWESLSEVSAVLNAERASRFRVPLWDTIENGEPDCHVRMLLRLHPLINTP